MPKQSARILAFMVVANDRQHIAERSQRRANGVAFHQTLKRQPWGAKNFVVKDPDGNLLLFAGPTK
jgi:uncharacterized glyoxalase superfamily protein PhnB